MKRAVGLLALLACAFACDDVEPTIEDFLAPASSPREAYVQDLERAGLDETALLEDWEASGAAALAAPAEAPMLFRAAVAIDPGGRATAWRVPIRRGQRLRLFVAGPPDTQIFLDAFAIDAREDAEPRPVGHADEDSRELNVEPQVDGELIVRAQPGLLSTGRFTATIEVQPTLGFPVAGYDINAVGSIFGDPRDGGVRDHHGIDIFADRGTPVVAATAGTVSRVQVTPRGGKVVWLRDAQRRQSLYYAHLDSQIVSDGMRVQPGDTLGLVGNTGNARTTPPHLHFGVYSRGPVDPVPYVRPVRGRIPELTDDTVLVGRRVRTTTNEASLRAGPSQETDALRSLPRATAVHVEAATGGWLQVRLPDGKAGYIPARAAEPVDAPLRASILNDGAPVHAGPGANAPVLGTLDRGARVVVYGRFDAYLLIRSEAGLQGWIDRSRASD